jgi:hypothetical protein
MKKKMFWLFVLSLAIGLTCIGTAVAQPVNYTFDITLEQIIDDVSLAGTLGKDDWYQWIYKVQVIEGGSTHNGLSHFTLELADCYITDEALLEVIENSAGFNGVSPNSGNLASLMGDTFRSFAVETGLDGSTGFSGIKWNAEEESDQLDEIGEYDYFWFSVPTDISQQLAGVAKFGGSQIELEVGSPECPTCHNTVPEPATMALFGAGLLGLLKRKERKIHG